MGRCDVVIDPETHRRLGMVARSRRTSMKEVIRALVDREYQVEINGAKAEVRDLKESIGKKF